MNCSLSREEENPTGSRGKIFFGKGEFDSEPLKGAHSFERAGRLVLSGVLRELQRAGFTNDEAYEVVYSKHIRWFLDRYDGDIESFAARKFREYVKEDGRGASAMKAEAAKWVRGEE